MTEISQPSTLDSQPGRTDPRFPGTKLGIISIEEHAAACNHMFCRSCLPLIRPIALVCDECGAWIHWPEKLSQVEYRARFPKRIYCADCDGPAACWQESGEYLCDYCCDHQDGHCEPLKSSDIRTFGPKSNRENFSGGAE